MESKTLKVNLYKLTKNQPAKLNTMLSEILLTNIENKQFNYLQTVFGNFIEKSNIFLIKSDYSLLKIQKQTESIYHPFNRKNQKFESEKAPI